MDDTEPASLPDRLAESLRQDERDRSRRLVERLETASADRRKAGVGVLRTVAEDRPSALGHLVPALAALVDDEDRTVRLRTVKLLVGLADATPEAATPAVDALADRLADDEEFYFVRARAAEALGYLALDRPDAVVSPEVLADLRVGLRFDEPEVKRKLAKALELVALGSPRRLQHHVASLADHLDDDDPIVRYHLCTALVAVGVESPEALDACAGALVERSSDDEEYVRGRAAEAIGLLARSNDDAVPGAAVDALSVHSDEAFVRDRVRFARAVLDGDAPDGPDDVGSVGGVRSTTRAAVDAVRRPDGDGCRQCGLDLPESVPPMCPRCGAPL